MREVTIGAGETAIYFAYAANMAAAVMSTSAPAHRFLGAARLDGHRLAFTRRSVITGTGVADVLGEPGSEVWGALYQLGGADLERLDRKEGVGFAYERVSVRVEIDGAVRRALAYTVLAKERPEIRPSAEYLSTILAAARERALPTGYVEGSNASSRRGVSTDTELRLSSSPRRSSTTAPSRGRPRPPGGRGPGRC